MNNANPPAGAGGNGGCSVVNYTCPTFSTSRRSFPRVRDTLSDMEKRRRENVLFDNGSACYRAIYHEEKTELPKEPLFLKVIRCRALTGLKKCVLTSEDLVEGNKTFKNGQKVFKAGDRVDIVHSKVYENFVERQRNSADSSKNPSSDSSSSSSSSIKTTENTTNNTINSNDDNKGSDNNNDDGNTKTETKTIHPPPISSSTTINTKNETASSSTSSISSSSHDPLTITSDGIPAAPSITSSSATNNNIASAIDCDTLLPPFIPLPPSSLSSSSLSSSSLLPPSTYDISLTHSHLLQQQQQQQDQDPYSYFPEMGFVDAIIPPEEIYGYAPAEAVEAARPPLITVVTGEITAPTDPPPFEANGRREEDMEHWEVMKMKRPKRNVSVREDRDMSSVWIIVTAKNGSQRIWQRDIALVSKVLKVLGEEFLKVDITDAGHATILARINHYDGGEERKCLYFRVNGNYGLWVDEGLFYKSKTEKYKPPQQPPPDDGKKEPGGKDDEKGGDGEDPDSHPDFDPDFDFYDVYDNSGMYDDSYF